MRARTHARGMQPLSTSFSFSSSSSSLYHPLSSFPSPFSLSPSVAHHLLLVLSALYASHPIISFCNMHIALYTIHKEKSAVFSDFSLFEVISPHIHIGTLRKTVLTFHFYFHGRSHYNIPNIIPDIIPNLGI